MASQILIVNDNNGDELSKLQPLMMMNVIK